MREIRGMLLGLHRTNSRVSLHSLTSFTGSINTKKVYKEVFQSLYRIGVTGEVLRQKKREILKIFGAQNSIEMDDSTIEDQNQFPAEGDQENILHTAAYGGHENTVQPLHTRDDSIKATAKEELRQITGEVMKVFGAQDSIQMDDTTTEDQNQFPVEDDQENILHTDTYGGHENTVQPLHTRGDSIKATDKDIKSPLHTTPLHMTPLHSPVRDGDTDMAKCLLENGTSIEATDEDNDTPLHLAAHDGLVLGKGTLIEALKNAALQLVAKVYVAYKQAPEDYRNICKEVKSLQIIIDKAIQYIQSTTLSDDDRQEGQEVLRSCQSVLEDMNSHIKYNSLAFAKSGWIVKKVQIGTEDIATLRARLISNTGLLNSFIQRFYIPTITIYQVYYANTSISASAAMACTVQTPEFLLLPSLEV